MSQMPCYFDAIGDPTQRCGYRIQEVEDVPSMIKGFHVTGPDWFAVFTPEQWTVYAAMPDEQFAAQMLAVGLQINLGMAVTVEGVVSV